MMRHIFMMAKCRTWVRPMEQYVRNCYLKYSNYPVRDDAVSWHLHLQSGKCPQR